MKRVALAFGLGLSLVVAGSLVLPTGWQHWREVAAAEDPAALADLRLAGALSDDRLGTEIDAALVARDTELAESFLALAAERDLAVSAERRQRLQVLKDGAFIQAVSDFGQGFIAGDRESGAAFAGALVGDVTG